MKLVIGNKNYSSWSLRPWLLMRQKGLAFEEVLIPLHDLASKERLLSFSSSGKVPILIDGAITVWDSLAIVEYLAESFPSAGIWPADAAARARARCVCAEMHSGFSALRTHMPMNLRANYNGAGLSEDVISDISRITDLWMNCRRDFGGSVAPFLFGDFCAADAFYAPVVTRFTTYGVKLAPACQAYADAVLALPALGEWTADAAAEPWRIPSSEIYESSGT